MTTTFLELRHFRLVKHIAETQSITRAAEQMHLSQPALSRQLRTIETKLGVTLFDRHGKTMIPTAAGRHLLSVAPALLEQAAHAEQAVLQMASGSVGSIRLSTECFTCYRWLPGIVEQFQAVYPQVEIDLNMQATDDPIAALVAGKLDLALVYSPITDPKLHATSLFRDALMAVLPPKHRLATRPYLAAEDFAEEHLLLYDAEASDVMREVLMPAGVRPRRCSSIRITDGLLNLVKAGLGITVVAGWAAAPDVAEGRLVTLPITADGMPRHWRAVRSATSAAPTYLTAFIDLLQAESPLSVKANGVVHTAGAPRPIKQRARNSGEITGILGEQHPDGLVDDV